MMAPDHEVRIDDDVAERLDALRRDGETRGDAVARLLEASDAPDIGDLEL